MISQSDNILHLIILIILLLFLIWMAYLTFVLREYTKPKRKILRQIKNVGIENILEDHLKQIQKLTMDSKALYRITDELSKIAAKSITKVGMVRFNPFRDTGGDQSFSIVMLDSQNNGIVISSLHGRGETRVYSKPIKEGKSEYKLSDEEIEAIKQTQTEENNLIVKNK